MQVSSGEAKEALVKWDIARTETLLVQYAAQRQHQAASVVQARESRADKLQGRASALEKADSVAQKALVKARQSLEQRILELDKCVRCVLVWPGCTPLPPPPLGDCV